MRVHAGFDACRSSMLPLFCTVPSGKSQGKAFRQFVSHDWVNMQARRWSVGLSGVQAALRLQLLSQRANTSWPGLLSDHPQPRALALQCLRTGEA